MFVLSSSVYKLEQLESTRNASTEIFCNLIFMYLFNIIILMFQRRITGGIQLMMFDHMSCVPVPAGGRTGGGAGAGCPLHAVRCRGIRLAHVHLLQPPHRPLQAQRRLVNRWSIAFIEMRVRETDAKLQRLFTVQQIQCINNRQTNINIKQKMNGCTFDVAF